MDDVGQALLRGLITAAAVAALLVLVRRWDHRGAGVLAGLPIITAPALAWLAFDRGAAFVAQAAGGVVITGAACAVFACAYGCASRYAGRVASAAVGLLACVATLPLLNLALPAWGLLALVVGVCLVCLGGLPQPVGERSPVKRRATHASCVSTAAVSGLISVVTSLMALRLGPFWSGVATSLPLIAAAVAIDLHGRAGAGAAVHFLRGYIGGLIGRSAFVALFATLVLPLGVTPAFAGAGGVCILVAAVVAAVTARRAPPYRIDGC